ncbi:hypothetical protein MRX96_009297 [Rhipicephalus microplus]
MAASRSAERAHPTLSAEERWPPGPMETGQRGARRRRQAGLEATIANREDDRDRDGNNSGVLSSSSLARTAGYDAP